MAKLDRSERCGLLHGSCRPGETSVYEDIAKEPTRMVNFGRAMQFFSSGEGYEVMSLVQAFPWADLGNGTVVDVSSILAPKFDYVNEKTSGRRGKRLRQCSNF